MSYLVLARKYRPQTFEQVIGQEHVTRTLQNAIRRKRIHHAFLFCGGRGTGKTTTARILAKSLSCVNAPTPDPCNECPACIEITQGTSVDVQEIDAASQNRVEDIRELREAIRYAPVRGKKKLYILDEVHMLSTSAFNALLKTLEEPPEHAVFVFATTDPHKLPQTILSRVQRYDFKLVPTARLVQHLEDVLQREKIEYEQGALYIIAREGAGSVRDSLSLMDQVLASAEGRVTEDLAAAVLGVADRRLILSLGQALVDRDAASALTLVADAYARGFDLSQLGRTLLAHLRDLVVVALVKEPLPLLDVPSSELVELERQAKDLGGRAELLFDRMVRVADDTSRAGMPRYVLEVGLVELCAVEPLQPIGELVERLEQIEDRLAGRPGRSGGSGSGGSFGSGERAASAPTPATRPRPPISSGEPAELRSAMPPAAPSPTPVVAAPIPAAAPRIVAAPAPPPAPPAPRVVAELPPPPVAVAPAAPAAVEVAPAAPPEKRRLSLDELPALLKGILEKQPHMAFLREARAISFNEDRLVLGLSSEFLIERAIDERARIQPLFAAELGAGLKLEWVLDTQAAADSAQRETLDAAEERARTAERSRRRREASDHQAVKLVRDVFGEVSFQEPEIEAEAIPHV